MLAPLRRCPASLPRALSATALTRTALRNQSVVAPRPVFSSRLAPRVSLRAFQSSVRLADASNSSQDEPRITTFRELGEKNIVHPNIVRAVVRDMRLETMTEVQSATIHQAIQGTDLIAQAKTGTGKTVGFLLPMLQNIISKDPALGDHDRFRKRRPSTDIRAIIISPTRELAEQIAVEARRMTAYTSIKVQTAVGGTGKKEGMRRIMREGCHVLVATPGRLNDILSDQYSGLSAPNLDYLIFDEADRLLESGFWAEIQAISDNLPDRDVRDRQTIMFSATIPKEVVSLVRQTLKSGFHFVKTVRDDEEPTHQRVPQKVVMTRGYETQLPVLLELCQREAEASMAADKPPFKAIVFFNSLKEVHVAYSAFKGIRRNQRRKGALWESDLLSIHSNLTQSSRQRMADTFRAAKRAVMFSTNVSARGMDFPNVTHVIQLGLPRDPADYIHRIGRTGRAGKEGEAWLILPEFDDSALRTSLRHLPIKEDSSLATAQVDLHALEGAPEHAAEIIRHVQDGFKEIPREELQEAYPGIITANANAKNRGVILDSMQTMATQLWGMESLPPLPPYVHRAIGLENTSRGGPARGGYSRDSGRGSSREKHSRNPSARNTRPWEGRGGFSRDSYDRPRGGGFSKDSYDRPRGGGFSRDSYDRPRGGSGRNSSFERRDRRSSFGRDMN
ncbi:putative DEAD box RNA helicase hela [Macrophomina phaseolina]|uniref:ATP-dependent RNA helicase n=1 Tax=Macrophomina phaseolina TaxID=35725 RepID=A0ABQ8FY89_9PEZI|nr:putative DEAD box RNA helicase hela [Macrophomina phaseolina]